MSKKIFNELVLQAWKDVDLENWQKIANELGEIFFKIAPPQYVNMMESYSNKDFEGVRIAAHTLKSTCGNVGAEKAHEILDQIEQSAKLAEAANNLHQLIENLSPVFEQSQSELKKFLAENQAA